MSVIIKELVFKTLITSLRHQLARIIESNKNSLSRPKLIQNKTILPPSKLKSTSQPLNNISFPEDFGITFDLQFFDK